MDKIKSLFLLKSFINIDSQTSNKLGVKEVQGLIADELICMDFDINWIKSTVNPHDFLLHGQKKSSNTNKMVVSFICHADTALSLRCLYQKTDERVLGTGCADNKGGILVGLLALSKFFEKYLTSDIEINFIVSPNEEIGSIGFHQQLKEIGERSTVVLGLEPALSNGNLIKSRSGNRWYHIITKGIQAHSGRINIPKLNSLHESIIKSEKIINLSRTLNNVRLNLNSISTSSDLYNTVPEETSIKLDLRFENNHDCILAHDEIVNILSFDTFSCELTNKSALSTFEITDDCPTMEEKTNLKSYYSAVESLLRSVSKNNDLFLDHSWGAADISHMSTKYNLTIDGLGPIGAGMHRDDEFIFVDSVFSRSELVFKILEYIHTQKMTHSPWRENEHDLQSCGQPTERSN